jgi:signal recognition particle GTPase
MRILMVGLDAAGKTTILYKLKLGEGEFLRPLALWTFMDIPSACAQEEALVLGLFNQRNWLTLYI